MDLHWDSNPQTSCSPNHCATFDIHAAIPFFLYGHTVYVDFAQIFWVVFVPVSCGFRGHKFTMPSVVPWWISASWTWCRSLVVQDGHSLTSMAKAPSLPPMKSSAITWPCLLSRIPLKVNFLTAWLTTSMLRLVFKCSLRGRGGFLHYYEKQFKARKSCVFFQCPSGCDRHRWLAWTFVSCCCR